MCSVYDINVSDRALAGWGSGLAGEGVAAGTATGVVVVGVDRLFANSTIRGMPALSNRSVNLCAWVGGNVGRRRIAGWMG